jgi:hypothetical protein
LIDFGVTRDTPKTIDTTLSKQASATMLNKDISHEIIEKYNAG